MKSRHKFYLGAGLVAVLFSFLLYACQKDVSLQTKLPPNKQQVSIYLTDAPGLFDHVFIDIQGIAVKVDTGATNHEEMDGEDDQGDHEKHHSGEEGEEHDRNDQGAVWDTLNIKPGVYDLLTFANGVDTLFASGQITKGTIIAFSITLGPNNSLVKDSTTYPLHLWNGVKTVYIRIAGEDMDEVTPDHFRFWIDFNAGRSVVRVDDGQFFLRPFLRAFAIDNTGSIEGIVKPADAFPVITVYNAKDTLYALPGKDGEFRVKGLWAGKYNVFVNVNKPYIDTTLDSVQVQAGMSTNVGTITIHK